MKFNLFKNSYFLNKIANLDKIIIYLITLLSILNVSYIENVESGEYKSTKSISREKEILLNKDNAYSPR